MKKRVLSIAIYIALIILLIFNLLMLFRLCGATEQAGGPQGGVIFDPNSSDERPGGSQSASPGVTVSGFSSLTIPPNVDTVAIDLYNPIENNGYYYMTFELRLLDGSGQGYEVLFLTKYLAPGKHIYQVTMSHGLPEGEYSAVLIVQPYRMEGLTPTNNVAAAVKLIVK